MKWRALGGLVVVALLVWAAYVSPAIAIFTAFTVVVAVGELFDASNGGSPERVRAGRAVSDP